MQELWDAFLAFNQNAFSCLVYAVSHNLWYIVIAACAIICCVMYLREELNVTVHEEQQVI